MTNLTQLRLAAREIFEAGLRAVDPSAPVLRAVRLEGSRLSICDTAIDIVNRPVYSIAIGKAAFAMAYALERALGESFAAGFMSGPVPSSTVIGIRGMHEWTLRTRWRWVDGGHPLPNKASLIAATEAFDLLDRANRDHALVIFLISGGGSAMIEWPINEDITLVDLRTANKALVNSGASIEEVNAVRRAFSAVKGGRLTARAPNCDQVTLIVSDVPADEERNVASGPSLAPPADAPDARDVIARYNLASQLPETIVRTVKSEPKLFAEDSSALRRHFVLLDNRRALEAVAEAARQRGFVTEIFSEISDQPITEGCTQLIERLTQLREQVERVPTESVGKVVCLISGGEFACPVTGDGIGGRNLETALRLACAATLSLSNKEHFVTVCAGTDGIDGNSPAAGGIIDNTTIARAKAIGLDPEDFLKRSDAYSFFVALGDVVATGPTGTNVRDLRILLGGRE